MNDTPDALSATELVALVDQVFELRASDLRIAMLIDLPSDDTSEDPLRLRAWQETREIACQWCMLLQQASSELDGRSIGLFAYPNVGTNNGDLPGAVWRCDPQKPPKHSDDLDPNEALELHSAVFEKHQIILALTRFSATAPLKLAAPRFGFRAATMPGFCRAMMPALRVDYREVDRRVRELAAWLSEAVAAHLEFEVAGQEHRLCLDLRYRQAHASGGLLPNPGIAGNLPSGEAYIVPYEGEVEGEASQSNGIMPVEFEGEVVLYRIDRNRAVEILTNGPASERERSRLETEPAYGNLAELGLGVLADFGVDPIGEVLIDEKLGLHIAFGRSDHFGGITGYSAFESPERVVHIDRVYLESTQPAVRVCRLDLEFADRTRLELMRDNRYTYIPGSAV